MTQEEKELKKIQWTGDNLKEVIEFTGRSPKFDEWFKTWEEYEEYVRSHGNIFKIFFENGSHYEVPVGSWIIKTPDGMNIPYTVTIGRLMKYESEKPMQDGFEEEIHKYNKERFDEYFPEQDGDFISEVDFMTCLDRVARHFAQWGAEHLKK